MRVHKKTEEGKQSTTAKDDSMPVIVEEDTTCHAADWADFMERGILMMSTVRRNVTNLNQMAVYAM